MRSEYGRCVALVGTTASGKSAISIEVTRKSKNQDVEILSVDSMSVYRSMDIATAKPSVAEQKEVPHHLIDLVEPNEEFTVATYQRLARVAMATLSKRSKKALLVGGTGLYLRAITDDLRFPGRFPEVAQELGRQADEPDGLEHLYQKLADKDPLAASRIAPQNRRRLLRALEVIEGSGTKLSDFGPGLERYPPTPVVMIGIPYSQAIVDAAIELRILSWMEAGLLEEVERLLESPVGLSKTARQALCYRELLSHLEENRPLETCVEEAITRTRQFARRQWSWFKRDPRIRWLSEDEDPISVVSQVLSTESFCHDQGVAVQVRN